MPKASDPGSSSGPTSNLLAPSVTSSGLHPTWSDASDPHHAGLHFREGSGNARKAKAVVESEERLVLFEESPHSYPPSHRTEQSSDLASAPMSAPTLFSRRAAPLSLPELDEYISSLPLPTFSSLSRTNAVTEGGRFVPLDRLASTGRSIESLETNLKGKPAWRNCSPILGGLVNTVIGITVGGLILTFFLLLYWTHPRGLALLQRITVCKACSTPSKYLH
jgi:hypothetical protein